MPQGSLGALGTRGPSLGSLGVRLGGLGKFGGGGGGDWEHLVCLDHLPCNLGHVAHFRVRWEH